MSFNNKKALVGAFHGHCETLQRFIDSYTPLPKSGKYNLTISVKQRVKIQINMLVGTPKRNYSLKFKFEINSPNIYI